ncbi:hypothetical protein ACGO3R_07630 [Lactococcus lactis]
MPRLLNLAFDYVDVRDVADLHLLALEKMKRLVSVSLQLQDKILLTKSKLSF